MNPYAATSRASPEAINPVLGNVAITLIGLMIGVLGIAGSLARFFDTIVQEPDQWTTWLTTLADITQTLGLGVFAAAACILLMMLIRKQNYPTSELRFSQFFIVVATLAMLSRILCEPNCPWTPHWPSYLLTFSAAIAMIMVGIRFRTRPCTGMEFS